MRSRSARTCGRARAGRPSPRCSTVVWVVDESRIADVTSWPAVTREGHRYEPARGDVFYAGETAEAVLLELEARRRRSLAEEIAADERELDAARTRGARRAPRPPSRPPRSWRLARRLPAIDPVLFRRVHAAVTRLADALRAAEAVAARLEAPLRARADAGGERTRELAESLRRLGADEADAASRRRRGGARSCPRSTSTLRACAAEADELQRRIGEEPVEHRGGAAGCPRGELERSSAGSRRLAR